MPDQKTHADSLRFYLTGAASHFGAQTNPNSALGNHQSSTEQGMSFNRTSPLANITLDLVGQQNSTGNGTLTATGADEVKWTPPGGTQGAGVTILNGETKIVEGGGGVSNINKFVRITRTAATALTGTETVAVSNPVNNVTGFDDVTFAEAAAGDTEYRCMAIENVSTVTITNVKARLHLLGTRQTTGVTQLPASGAGSIKTAANFNDWPATGYALVKTNAPAVRECVYYSSRTADTLTVPATGRALQGTSAAAGAATDTVDAIPGIAIAKEAPNAQPTGNFQTVANENTAPTAVTFSLPVESDGSDAISIGSLATTEIYGIWMRRVVSAGHQATQNAVQGVLTTWDGS